MAWGQAEKRERIQRVPHAFVPPFETQHIAVTLCRAFDVDRREGRTSRVYANPDLDFWRRAETIFSLDFARAEMRMFGCAARQGNLLGLAVSSALLDCKTMQSRN